MKKLIILILLIIVSGLILKYCPALMAVPVISILVICILSASVFIGFFLILVELFK